MPRLFKIALSWILLVLACEACLLFQHAPVTDGLAVVRYNPVPEYQQWAQEALDCAKVLKARNPALPFAVVHDSVDVRNFVWYAVATEAPDHGFPCAQAKRCVGLSAHDTILVSSWHVSNPWVIKHETMHWFVESPTETLTVHGLPWGMCEGPISG